MRSAPVLLVTDRADRSRSLAQAVDRVADCQILAVDQPWYLAAPVLGIIADVSPARTQTRACLRWLSHQSVAQGQPALFLVGQTPDTVLREAQAWGPVACLPAHTEARVAVATLVRLIDPRSSVTDRIVRRAAARTAGLLEAMFRNAETAPVDLLAVEGAIDPVLDALQDGGLARWLDVIWEHDDTTFQHCLLVAGLVCAFAQDLGLSRTDRHTMARAALVHDVGKARIPLAILNKPGRLEPDEMAVMRTHAALGHDILEASGSCDPVALAVTRHHHEMLDGSGYPDGLRGAAIADPIRLLTVCDIYAALIERRPYKAPYASHEAMRILHGMAGQLDAALVDAFGRTVTTAAAGPSGADALSACG